MKKIAYDSVKLDAMHIMEDSKCCLKVNAVISKAGVYLYDDGWALKPTTELLRATRTARNAKVTLHNHPDSKVIMSQNQLFGLIEKPFFDRDKIHAIINFDKYVTPPEILQKVRDAVAKKTGLDVSIGFYYAPDFTPGYAPDVNTGKNRHYDYVMRDILIDHVAVMFDGRVQGRCTFPNCGVGVDNILQKIQVKGDKVVKRGEQWCVVHCHPDGSIGETIKCFPTEEQAEAMHRAIQAKKHDSWWLTKYLFGDQDDRPPKEWMDTCMTRASKFADNAGAFCNWVWHNEPKLRASFGASSVSTKGGNQNMSETESIGGLTSETEFQKCVRTRVAEGMTEEEAKTYCMAYTTPDDQPGEPAKTQPEDVGQTGGAQQEPSPWQKCVNEEKAKGKSQEEAEETCKAKGITKTDQDTAYEECIRQKIGEGLSQAEAEKQCRLEQPPAEQLTEGAQETEKTELERCIENQVDLGKTAEEAREWCEAELAGEHQPAEDILSHSEKMLQMREHQKVEQMRKKLRHSL